VRTKTEFDAGHILCALNYSWPRTSQTHENEETGRDGKLYYDYGYLLPYKDYDIIVCCSSGTRSGEAAQFLAEKGFTHIFNMTEGMDGWMDQGYQTVTGNAECSLPPMAHAGADQTVTEAQMVTLDGSGSSVSGGLIVSYAWTQTGGSENVVLSDPASPTPTFKAPNVGTEGDTLVFNLVVTSDSGNTDTDSVEIYVNWFNYPPSADAGQDQIVSQGAKVTLVGTGSSDSDGTIVSYKWRFTAAQNISPTDITLSDDTSPFPVFTAPAKNGSVTFSLTVTDNEGGKDSDMVRITVDGTGGNAPPVADAGSPQTVVQGAEVTLVGSGSSDPDDGIENYSWIQMEGPSVTLSDPNVPSPTFTAPVVGSEGAILKFALIVSDHSGLMAADTVSIQIISEYTQAQIDQAVLQERQRWDVNGDNRIGVEEAVLSMQTAAGIRMQADGLDLTRTTSSSFRNVSSRPSFPIQTFSYDQDDLEQAVMQERQRWDVNGDNTMGLEEAIRALQVAAGILP